MNWYKLSQYYYHGSNQDIGDTFIVQNKNGKEGIGWLTDDKDYAYQHGNKIHKVLLNGQKPLSPETIINIDRNEIFYAMKKIKNDLEEDFFNNYLYPKIEENISKYKNGEISSENIFSGMGGVAILKNLGFTHEIILNPYDKSGNTHFIKVFNGDSVKIIK